MLSRKVTCAIVVLNELYCSRCNEKTGSKTLRRAVLVKKCDLDSRTFRRVIQQLSLSQYIETVGTSIVLSCNPNELTIYELFLSIHGGIPLGEEMEQANHYAEKGYSKIDLLEANISEVSRKYFERRTVASLISKNRNKHNI